MDNYRERYGLSVKREDLSCPSPGPPFSKTRGVYAHLSKIDHDIIGVLDTYHSQAGHAVSRACQILGKNCINFYPEYKNEPGHREPQDQAKKLGADLHGLKAGRSCILFHQARKIIESRGGYMMPNALKLDESVTETASEVQDDYRRFDKVLIAASSGTIAAGVIKGFADIGQNPRYIIHLGYSRSHEQVERYLKKKSGVDEGLRLFIIDEGYGYRDTAKDGIDPPFPCNEYYDLKTFRWWVKYGRKEFGTGSTLFWNIG